VLLGVTNAPRQGRRHPGDPGADQQPEAFAKFQAAQESCREPFPGCWWWRRTTRSSNPTPTSAISRLSSKGPRTGSRSRGTATSGGTGVQRDGALLPLHLTAMVFGYKTKANFTVENEKEVSKPPKVDFAPAPTKP